ncbi:MAG: hypothetical protein V3R67_08870 [Thermodesulfobacteriota bacterium]
MKRIYKYKLGIEGGKPGIPRFAQILKADFQGHDLMIWAVVDPEDIDTYEREFAVYGTGHDMEERPRKFISTVFIDNLVFHVFEVFN